MAARHPAVWLLASMALTVAVYWVGLHGPFVLDDAANFRIIQHWLSGAAPLQDVLFGNRGWLDHRSVAMASFAASAALSGYDTFAFKLANLLLHLSCGLVGYALLRRLLSRDTVLGEKAQMAAAAIMVVWLLHPLHASTVLYAVQRMTQLATLFCLLGLWLYAAVRDRMERGETRHSLLALFVGIPALVLLGIQSKQNAVVLPALCLVVELAFYSRPTNWPRNIKTFFALTVLLPSVLLAALLMVTPDVLLHGYAGYDFDPFQRLLSQGRALCNYLRQLLFPYTPSMGVSTDDYIASTGWLTPATTLPALALLGVLSFGAWRVRDRLPSVFAGWFFFLAAHSVESSFLPLELYYEHRNYLPSLGIFLAAGGLAAASAEYLAARQVRIGRVSVVCAVALALMLGFLTHGRARVWAHPVVLAESELRHHPQSARAALNYVGIASDLGAIERAYAVTDQLIASSSDPKLKGRLMLFKASLDCRHRGGVSVEDARAAVETLPPHFDLGTFLPLDYLTTTVESGKCGPLDKAQMAALLARVADRASKQPDDFKLKWALRNRSAILFAQAGHWEEAVLQARLGWQPSTLGGGAEALVQIFLVAGTLEEAERVFAEAWARTQGDEDARRALAAAEPLLVQERRSPGWNRRRFKAQDAVENE